MKYYLFLWFVLSSLMAFGQRNYDEALKMGDDAFQQGQYDVALQKYRAAQVFDLTKQTIIDDKIILIFKAIQAQKASADAAKAEAEKARILAKKAESLAKQTLKSVERARQESEELRRIAESARNEAYLANAKLKNIVDVFYFYDNKLALAYKQDDQSSGSYGFIDTSGNIKIDFKYSEANLFDEGTGLAKVKFENSYYLLDTTGQEFLLAESLSELTDAIEALDLSKRELDRFPVEILQYPNLKILLLYGNNIKSIPDLIGSFSSLIRLDLSNNQIENLPASFANLTKLESLDLSNNDLSETNLNFANLEKLEILSLANNQIKSLPTFQNLPKLRILDLSFNKIQGTIPDFSSLDQLSSINLNGNDLISENSPSNSKVTVKTQELGRQVTPAETGELGETARAYQAWLNQVGLGPLLSVYEIKEGDDKVDLYLSLPFQSSESVASAWTMLQQKFTEKNFMPLQNSLFHNMLRIFDTDPGKSSIQIYDTYDLSKTICFFEGIYYELGKVKIENNRCKGMPIKLDNLPIEINNIRTSGTIYAIDNLSKINEALDTFMHDYFSLSSCSSTNKIPPIQLEDTNTYSLGSDCISQFIKKHPSLCQALDKAGIKCISDALPIELKLMISVDEKNNGIIIETYAKNIGESTSWIGENFGPFSKQFGELFIQDFNEGLLKQKTKGQQFVQTETKKSKIIYVKAGSNGKGDSWDNALSDLQEAIALAKKGDQIWVAVGTYHPTTNTNRNISFHIRDGIQLYGGFSGNEKKTSDRELTKNASVLSGEIGTPSLDDNSFTVVYTDGVSEATVIDGFTITRGASNGFTVNGDLSFSGAGWFNNASRKSSSPTVKNCIFINNYAREGAGFYNYASQNQSNPLIANCVFLNNKADFDGGGIFNMAINTTSRPKIINSSFKNNHATYGGAILNKTVDGSLVVVIDNCTFVGNFSVLQGQVYNHREGSGNTKSEVTNSTFEESNSKLNRKSPQGNGGAILRNH